MFIRKLDFLSPSITLYYKGEPSHSSIASGILTIIVYSICLTFGIVYAIQFINKDNPRVCYYNRYVEDAGEFPVNSSSMFNFIQMLDTEKNIPDKVNFDLITIIGIEQTVDIYQDNNDLSKYNHWIYGPCNNSTDIQGIDDLVTFSHFTESACIRKYYNKDEKKYYDTDDKNFIWPVILHGCSHPNRTFYGIIVEKCRNDTLKFSRDGKYCKSPDEIIKYIRARSINFQLIDQFTDILNYTTPYRKYFYSISNGLFEETYTTNHLNLNPTKLISDEGNFFQNKIETLSYFFDLNEKITSSSGDSGIYVAFYFWMQNRMQYYERVYEKVQDVLSDVGGLCSIVLTIAELLNILVNQYTNLFDTQSYMNEIENSKLYERNIFKLNLNNNLVNINQNNINKLSPPKNISSSNIQNMNESNSKGVLNNEIEIYDKKMKKINKRKKLKKSEIIVLNNENKYINNINNLNINNRRTGGNSLTYKRNLISNNQEKVGGEQGDQSNYHLKNNANNNNKNNSNNNNKEKNIIETKNSIIKLTNIKQIKFTHYLAYLISLTKCHPNLRLYSDFRIKMISEENLILSNLNINKILKKMNDENSILNQELDNTPKLNY